MLDGHVARLEAVEADERFTGERVHGAVGIHNVDDGQLVPLADVEVRLVVRGRDFQHAGAESEIHVVVANDRDELFRVGNLDGQRTANLLADEMRVARILRIHGDGGVAGNGLGTRGGDGQERAGLLRHLHFEVIHRPVLRLHLHLLVGERSERSGAPVDHAFTAIDQALFIKVHKDPLHTLRVVLIHGEALALPVAGAAEFLELLDDDAAVLVLPLPDFLQKFLAPEVVAMADDTLLFQRALDDGLRGDAGVIGAGKPKHFLALHARAAGEDVLDGIVQDVAEGQDAGDIRRRDDDGIRGLF